MLHSQETCHGPWMLFSLLANILVCVALLQSGFIKIKSRVLGDHIEVSVEDSGIGVPQDKLEAIFDPYEQVGVQRREGSGSKVLAHHT